LYTIGGSTRVIVGLSYIPAGTYVVISTIRNRGGDDVGCVNVGDSQITGPSDFGTVKDGAISTITSVVQTSYEAYAINVQCDSNSSVGLDATVTAIPVSALN
jgi:hypothetical protein